MSEMTEDVWAEEGGTRLKVESYKGYVKLTIYDINGSPGATATIADYRWKRVVAACQEQAP